MIYEGEPEFFDMMIKYNGQKFGGYLAIVGFRVKYYFYWVKERMDGEKVLARVFTNG